MKNAMKSAIAMIHCSVSTINISPEEGRGHA